MRRMPCGLGIAMTTTRLSPLTPSGSQASPHNLLAKPLRNILYVGQNSNVNLEASLYNTVGLTFTGLYMILEILIIGIN